MTYLVECHKLKKQAPGLDGPPYPGEWGQRIYQEISEEAWQQWLAHQTMLINEYRLSVIEPEARRFLEQQMIDFLFGEGGERPPGYQPEE